MRQDQSAARSVVHSSESPPSQRARDVIRPLPPYRLGSLSFLDSMAHRLSLLVPLNLPHSTPFTFPVLVRAFLSSLFILLHCLQSNLILQFATPDWTFKSFPTLSIFASLTWRRSSFLPPQFRVQSTRTHSHDWPCTS